MASTVPPKLQIVADRAAAAALLHAKRLEELRCVVDTSESCKALVNSPIFHGVTDIVKEGELVILYAGYDSIFPVVLKPKDTITVNTAILRTVKLSENVTARE